MCRCWQGDLVFIAASSLWLQQFSGEFKNWSGVSLKDGGTFNQNLRHSIIRQNPSLLDVRNYLFSRQAVLLLKLSTPWEVSISYSMFRFFKSY